MGWAPASFLVPVDDDDLEEEAKENKAILCSMRGGCIYEVKGDMSLEGHLTKDLDL